GTAQGYTFFLDQRLKVACQYVGGVSNHGVVDLADGGRRIVPCFVREVGVGRNAVDFDAQLLELRVQVSQVFQFGGAHERKVGGVENKDRPLAGDRLVRDLDELAVVVSRCFKRFNLRIDQGHNVSSFVLIGRCEESI